MNWRVVVCALLPLTGPAGCTLYRTAARNLHNEPREVLGGEKIEHRLRKSAREALAECAGRHPKKVFSHEFRDGFIDGYADYLDSGGPCVPPPIPPYKYRGPKYFSPEGHAKIRDYFLGFKYGVDVAVATGLRPYLTLPVLVAEQGPPPPLNITVLPAPPDGLSTDPPAAPVDTTPLPPPRPVDPQPAAPPIPLPKVGTPPPDGVIPSPVQPVPPVSPQPAPSPTPDKPRETGGKSANLAPLPQIPVPPAPAPAAARKPTVPEPPAADAATAVIPAPVPIPVTVRPAGVPNPVVTPPGGPPAAAPTRTVAAPIPAERKAP